MCAVRNYFACSFHPGGSLWHMPIAPGLSCSVPTTAAASRNVTFAVAARFQNSKRKEQSVAPASSARRCLPAPCRSSLGPTFAGGGKRSERILTFLLELAKGVG